MTTRAIHRTEYEYFRELLVEARAAAGLTQVEVAQQLGKPQSFVSKYERGERRIDFTEFLEIAEALALDVEGFIQAYRVKLRRLPLSARSRVRA